MSNSTRPPIGTIVCALLGFAVLASLVRQAPPRHAALGTLSKGYRVTARFDNVGDLRVGSPLTIAGVRIGAVDLVGYDPAVGRAVVTFRITRPSVQLPIDSVASVRSLSPLGGKQVVISPGAASEYLADGSEISETKSALGLEMLIERSMSAATAHMAKPK